MKKLFLLLISAIILVPHFAHAATITVDSIVISQVQPSTSINASDEIVTIFNNSDSSLDISGLSVEYKSATGTSWSKRAEVADNTVLEEGHEYVFASVRDGDAKLSTGLAQGGGNVRILSSEDAELDRLAWGNGDSPEAEAVEAPGKGDTISRKNIADSEKLTNTHNNKDDFEVLIDPAVTNSNTAADEQQTSESVGLDLQINELFPDPETPKTDSKDEFVELYNPNDQAVNLSGWQIRDEGGKVFKFASSDVINAHGYAVFYSSTTKISLNNGGDSIELIDPAGNSIDVSVNYGDSAEGLTWGITEDGWAWMEPTPASANGPAVSIEKVEKAKKETAKKTKKTKAKAAKKAKASKIGSSADDGIEGNEDETATKPLYKVWSWLLIVAGVGTIGYGIYEYRPEIKNAFIRFRSKFGRS